MKIIFFSCFCVLLCLCVSSQTYNYYFGNLHAHTAFSDGNKDSLSSGAARPDAAYTFAKLSHNFDFLGISEHNHYSSIHNPGFKVARYQPGLAMADAANQDSSFACLFGMEYGISSSHNGHVIVYGFNGLIGWETNVGGETGNNYNIFNAKSDYESLFRKVKNNPNAFAYLAHPYWTDFTKNGSDSTAIALSKYNAMYDSAIVGMPLRSGNAFSTFQDYSDYSTGDYFNYYKKMLYIGYHLGIGYDHDNHYTNFGRGNAGRLVVLAPSLSRANIITAMQQMHFYGSDDFNAKVEFTLNESMMGSVISGNQYPEITVVHNDEDGEQADTVRIWRGNKNSGGLWAQPVQMVLHANATTYTDHNIVPGIEYYYFADIKQADGQWIVTSPIWYTALANVSIKENTQAINFTCFPNPASKKLTLDFGKADAYTVSIFDLSGRLVFKTLCYDKNTTLNMADVIQGVYLLQVKTSSGAVSRRIVIE